MYIAPDKIIPMGEKLIQAYKISPEVIIRNRLSKKPTLAVQELKKIVEGSNSICKNYDLDIMQDYSRGVVKLNLLEQCYTFNISRNLPNYTPRGQYICQSSELPITASAKRYIQAVRKMLLKDEADLKKLREEPVKRKQNNNWLKRFLPFL